MSGSKADPEWLAATIVPSITPEQAQEALDDLQAAGMMPGQSMQSATTGHQVSFSMHGVHEQFIELGKEANWRWRQEDRHVAAFNATISKEGWEALQRRIERLFEVMFDHCETDPHPPDRVLQFNLQAFPVTRNAGTELEPWQEFEE